MPTTKNNNIVDIMKSIASVVDASRVGREGMTVFNDFIQVMDKNNDFSDDDCGCENETDELYSTLVNIVDTMEYIAFDLDATWTEDMSSTLQDISNKFDTDIRLMIEMCEDGGRKRDYNRAEKRLCTVCDNMDYFLSDIACCDYLLPLHAELDEAKSSMTDLWDKISEIFNGEG